MQAKGFDVVWIGPRVEHGELKAALANANQFWLISNGSAMLSDAAIEVIVDEWSNGMGMYVSLATFPCLLSRASNVGEQTGSWAKLRPCGYDAKLPCVPPVPASQTYRMSLTPCRVRMPRYIFGDNEPLYVDANRVLKVLGSRGEMNKG